MILKMRKENQIKSFEITSEQSYINRRSLIKSLGILSATPFFSNTFAENNAADEYFLKAVEVFNRSVRTNKDWLKMKGRAVSDD